MLRIAVALAVCHTCRAQLSSVTTGEHRATDICFVANHHIRRIAIKLHDSHVATAIDVLIERAASDVDKRLSIDACHIVESIYSRR